MIEYLILFLNILQNTKNKNSILKDLSFDSFKLKVLEWKFTLPLQNRKR